MIGIMSSHARITYNQLQKSFETSNTKYIKNKISIQNVHNLYKAYRALEYNRKRRHTLDIEFPEAKILLDDQFNVKNIFANSRKMSHKIVEEFMILANVATAQFISENNNLYLSRIHESPRSDKILELANFVKRNKINSSNKIFRHKHFQQISKNVKGTCFEHIANSLILRSQSKAKYANSAIGHFGLNLDFYAHFTSPIRRYADLTTHRIIKNILAKKINKLNNYDFDTIGDHLSLREKEAVSAERQTNDRYIARYLEQQKLHSVRGYISCITHFALFITLPDIFADAILPLENIQGDFFTYHRYKQILKSRKHNITLSLGDNINAVIQKTCSLSGKIILKLHVNTLKK